jgi:ABC-type polysaccharide/polyol phosphate transport system ATPase subunit
MRNARIEFHRVWKKFRRGELHDSLRDLIPAAARRLLGRGRKRDELTAGEFWAVRDVSFTVEPGEALGILGPNGAGKSTILKLLTQILTPTRGRCLITGRAGALIEVAAGFHPDLTGRENIYLQGAIMGMRRAEITRRFEEIVEFAEIGPFIDTPVKRYSNGMNARLGFAIAAHIDPDVLVIDEVLAVGDLRFQQKAFERIKAMCSSGIPVAIVSHQLERIAALCTHALLLDRGRVVRRGTPTECIEAYLNNEWASEPATSRRTPVGLASFALVAPATPCSGDRVHLRLTGTVNPEIPGRKACTLRVRALATGKVLFAVSTEQCGVVLPEEGSFELDIELELNVSAGVYAVETAVWDRAVQRDVLRGPSITLQVAEGQAFSGTVQMHPRMHLAQGALHEVRSAS